MSISSRTLPVIMCMALCALPQVINGQDEGIDDAPRIADVTFRGNQTFDDDRLAAIMLSRPSGLFRTERFDPDVLADDIETLVLFYQGQGFLETTAVDSVSIDAQNTARIWITIDEGPRTIIESVSFIGNEALPDSLLALHAQIAPGEPFIRRAIEDAAVALLTLYADQGYLEADVMPDIRTSEERHTAIIDIAVIEGTQSFIDDIRLVGLSDTRPYVIERELTFATGELVNYSKLLRSQHNIYLTGLFQSVFIRPEPDDSGREDVKDIIVEVREIKSGEVSAAVGYGSIERARITVEGRNTSLWGTARKAGLLTKVSTLVREARASYTAPRTFGSFWQTDLNAGISYTIEPGYDVLQTGGTMTLGRTFAQRTTLTGTYRHEDGTVKNITAREVPDDATITTRSLMLSAVYDSRNNLFNPTGGRYASLSTEWGGFSLKGADRFFRLESTLKMFFPYHDHTVFATGIDVGWIDTPKGIGNIPLQERYYTGGPNSIRGFRYHRLGPVDANGKPRGGRLKIVWNVIEYRRQLFWKISAVAFLDAGNVWRSSEQCTIDTVRYGTGLGLRMTTPIGLARVDYGHNPDRIPDEPSGQWYFSLGQAF